jgi:hypothetical protein
MRNTNFQAQAPAFVPLSRTKRRQANHQTITKGPMTEIVVLGF